MSEYPVGTVATANYQARRGIALRGGKGWTTTATGETVYLHDNDGLKLTDIRPQVVLDLTRENADDLAEIRADYAGEISLAQAQLLERIRDAIRDQLPAPLEIPENLGAVVEHPSGCPFVYLPLAQCPDDPWVNAAGARHPTANVRSWAVKVLSPGVES
jgi:hypothetical protein